MVCLYKVSLSYSVEDERNDRVRRVEEAEKDELGERLHFRVKYWLYNIHCKLDGLYEELVDSHWF